MWMVQRKLTSFTENIRGDHVRLTQSKAIRSYIVSSLDTTLTSFVYAVCWTGLWTVYLNRTLFRLLLYIFLLLTFKFLSHYLDTYSYCCTPSCPPSSCPALYSFHLFIFSWYNNYIKAEQWQHQKNSDTIGKPGRKGLSDDTYNLPRSWNQACRSGGLRRRQWFRWSVVIVTIRPSGEQIAQCPNPSHNNGVSYKIYIYLQEYTESPPSEIQCHFHDIHSKHRLPPTSSYSRHSAVSSCPSHFLAPPTPPFPLNPWPRRQRDRVATAWLQLAHKY